MTSTSRGQPAPFRKTAPPGHPGILAFEAAGLRALRGAGARVPKVHHADAETIVMDRVSDGPRPTPQQESQFGRDLAALHRTTGEWFGACEPELTGYLGLQPIDLTPTPDWADSYLVRRLRPLVGEAVRAGQLPAEADDLAGALTREQLGPPEPPRLVHGDLWAGNRLVDPEGNSWLIDPSAHYGHREYDLAMMRLFGGFSEQVFLAYDDAFPLQPGWRSRVPVYQAVPLVVHVLLFGAGYRRQTMTALTMAAGDSPTPAPQRTTPRSAAPLPFDRHR